MLLPGVSACPSPVIPRDDAPGRRLILADTAVRSQSPPFGVPLGRFHIVVLDPTFLSDDNKEENIRGYDIIRYYRM